MIYQTVLLAAVAASASASVQETPMENIKMMFEQFKLDFQKKYHDDEEHTRFENFVQTIHAIHARNAAEKAKGGSATHGITKFADLSSDEFKARYLTYTPVSAEERSTTTATVKKYQGSDSLVDWTGIYTTPVKDQGYCGSCWAFAASEQIESEAMRELNVTYTVSPQQLVECDRSSLGCNGGLQERAYNYVKRAGGIETEQDYPYTSGATGDDSHACSTDKSKFVLGLTGYETVKTESDMTDYVKSTGPLSIAIDASTWSTYTGGILSDCGTQINHAVQLVGVDTDAGYWKVRNSWSETWGEGGYIRLAYGQDTCGITYDVTHVTGVFKA